MVSSSSDLPLRLAVIGAGVMGQHHLRICSLLKGISLVGVVDIHSDRAKAASLKFGCPAYSCLEDVVGKVDAVIIAVPSQSHVPVGLFFLQNGIHCLIEKPLALTEADCLKLINLAEQQRLVLAVGHTEHYNSAVQELRKLIDKDHLIVAIEASRLNYGSRRISDVDVVLDLMIHDIQIVESLVNHPVASIEAWSGRRVEEDVSLNHVLANIAFTNGTLANLTASRITPKCARQLRITTDKAYFSLDYQTQELLKFELLSAKGESLPVAQASLTDRLVSQRIPVRMQDALFAEISAFRESILSGSKQYVDGQQALSALKLAWAIQEKTEALRPITTSLQSEKQAILA